MNTPSNKFSNSVINLLAIVALSITGIFGILRYLKSENTGFFTVETSPKIVNIVSPPDSRLLKNNYFEAKFKATLPHLGIVSIRFDTFDRINNDTLRFKLIKINKNEKLYEGSYKTDQFQPEKLFPFGFPVVADSEGETFQINLTSETGSPSSSVAISHNLPFITTRYVLNINTLRREPILLYRFFRYKITNFISNPRFISYLTISFLPLCLYLFLYKKIKNKLGLFTFTMFVILIGIPRISPEPIVEIFSATAVISLILLTISSVRKAIHYNNKNV